MYYNNVLPKGQTYMSKTPAWAMFHFMLHFDRPATKSSKC